MNGCGCVAGDTVLVFSIYTLVSFSMYTYFALFAQSRENGSFAQQKRNSFLDTKMQYLKQYGSFWQTD
jgi:hypothetical protein